MTFIKRYRKFLVAIGAAIGVLITQLTVGDTISWPPILLAFLGSIGVYAVPNEPAPTQAGPPPSA